MKNLWGLVLLAGLASGLCRADEPTIEVFDDHGLIFIRAGTNAGLAVGETVAILGEKNHKVGSAAVMQVWPAMARVNLDAAAKADRSAKKLAVVEKKAPPPPPGLTPPPPPPTTTPIAAPPGTGPLAGHATFRGLGHFKVLQLTNDSPTKWTHCNLRLPGNLVYALDHLDAGDHESIVRSNFKLQGPERDVPIDFVSVTCTEGTGTFVFPD